ncbi:MAG: hypothetical protein A4E19_15710 [Nitrospira sp. SG-bin1]|nr:MAG: hypothetical protein A4E19_15710 [Nitrospira sp. SG-bin1]
MQNQRADRPYVGSDGFCEFTRLFGGSLICLTEKTELSLREITVQTTSKGEWADERTSGMSDNMGTCSFRRLDRL